MNGMNPFETMRQQLIYVADLSRRLWKSAPVSDLTDMQVSEISLVDRPANPGATVVLAKRHEKTT